MGRIYEGDVKLNNLQVLDKLKGEMTEDHKITLRAGLNGQTESKNYRKRLAHAILDSYKSFTGTDDNTMSVKKCLKHLMEKYMKSSTVESDGAYQSFISWVMTDSATQS